MKILRAAAVACALTLPMAAGTIDASTAATETLHSGDTLTLLFSASSFFSHAAAVGISPYPAQFTFSFSTLPVNSQGQFEATLESTDGSATAAWAGALAWSSGKIQSAGYAGDVSTIYGALNLPATLAQRLFESSQAELMLKYSGPDISIGGIPGFTLEQDFRAGLSGGGLSVGAMNYDLTLSGRSASDGFSAVGFTQLADSPVPEPESAINLLAAAALFTASGAFRRVSLRLKRFAKSGIK